MKKPKNRFVAWTEKVLLLGGLTCVALWIGSNAVPVLWQNWDNWVFDREVRGQPANLRAYLGEKRQRVVSAAANWLGLDDGEQPRSNMQSAPLKDNALIGRLTIPRLHLNTTVREGTGDNILVLAAGHLRGTALPGGKGNVAVAAHRDTLFSGLAGIRKNDLIEFETLRGSYQYQVASIGVVKPDDVSVLKPRRDPELTLITCYPFDYIGPAPDRFVVKARQVSAGPAQPPPTIQAPTIQAPAISSPVIPADPAPPAGKQTFYVSKRHSLQLAPGISIGLDETDPAAGQVKGWLWIMPDRRTIWLKDQPAQEPLVFYQNGERRELMITSVTSSSIAGYLRPNDNHTLAR